MAEDSKFLALFFIQTSLGFEPKNYPEGLLNKLVRTAPIHYTYVNDDLLEDLEKKGVPARSQLPFAASWLAIVESLRKINPHAAPWISTLLYAEWSFMYWFCRITELEIKEELVSKLKFKSYTEKQIGKERIVSIGTSPTDVIIKWWLDDIIVKIRALWDKLPYAIAESSQPRVDLKGNNHNARINELLRNRARLSIQPEAESFFERLVKEMRNIEYVRKHRDAELHRHAKPYAEVLGLYGKHETLVDVWEKLGGELNRCREALMGTIGLILLRTESGAL